MSRAFLENLILYKIVWFRINEKSEKKGLIYSANNSRNFLMADTDEQFHLKMQKNKNIRIGKLGNNFFLGLARKRYKFLGNSISGPNFCPNDTFSYVHLHYLVKKNRKKAINTGLRFMVLCTLHI